MSDVYYLGPANLFANYTSAQGPDVRAQFQAVADSFSLLPAPDVLREGRIGYVIDSGTANSIVVALPTAPTGYATGLTMRIKVLATATATPSVNVNGLGAKALKRPDGSAIQNGDITAGTIIEIMFDGDDFRLTGGGNIPATAVAQAQGYAASALNAPGTSATSSTNMTVGTGNKAFTLNQVGKAYALGQTITIASTASPTNQMVGILTAFDPSTGTMTVSVSNTNGAGTFASWTVSLGSIAGLATIGSITGGGLATGGGSASTNQIITVTAASVVQVKAGTSTSTVVTPQNLRDTQAWVALASAASLTPDHNDGINRTLTLAHNATLQTPTNPAVGETWAMYITQDATGGRTLAYSAFYLFKNGQDPVLPAAIGAKSLLECKIISAAEAVCVLHGPVS